MPVRSAAARSSSTWRSTQVSRARLVADGSELKIYQPWNAKEYSDDAFINFPGASLPDEWDTVIALELL